MIFASEGNVPNTKMHRGRVPQPLLLLASLALAFIVSTPSHVFAFVPNPSSTFSLSHNGGGLAHRNLLGFTGYNAYDSMKNFKSLQPNQSSLVRPVRAVQGTLSPTLIARSPFPPAVRNAIMIGFAVLLVLVQRRRIFYPGTFPDPSVKEPLPPGTIGGCPWFGSLSMFSNMNKFLYRTSDKLGSPKIWKLFAFANPMAVLSGSSVIKTVLSKEFKGDGISQPTQLGNIIELFGNQSMSFETKDKDKYNFLRRLIGQAMTPEAVAKGIPALQRASEQSINKMIESKTVVAEDICKDLTLDVAWRQIIGLDLKDGKEIQDFHDSVQTWLKGILNTAYIFLPKWFVVKTKAYKAKEFLTRKIEEKIDNLERRGPDGSTMSSMVFATDDEDRSKKLTRQQVIDNALLLILAGSETSANTLVNALLFLGMYADVWRKLVAEQMVLEKKYGAVLTKEQLDNECPYLDAFLKETMRIMPVSGGATRVVDETIVIDGVQIPKKWWIMASVSLTHAQDPITCKQDGSHMDIHKGFKPERWLDEQTRPSTEYMPWGAGYRFCVGHVLATAEMKVFLAVLARSVKGIDILSNVDPIKWKRGVIDTPQDGLILQIKE